MVTKVDIKREYSRAMKENIIIKCTLRQSRNFVDINDEGDHHFRLCESQFMRSFSHQHHNNNKSRNKKKDLQIF